VSWVRSLLCAHCINIPGLPVSDPLRAARSIDGSAVDLVVCTDGRTSKYCLIHFFHPDFARCRIMDQKLEELAPKYPHTLFLRTSVGDAPFLVNKLGVQVLPCVHVFVDSKGVDR